MINAAAKLTGDELTRYARHLVMPEIGGAGQQKLKSAKVLVVGAGGLGAPVLMYLAAAGVGTLGIVDDDEVDLSNLQRQIIHNIETVGQHKTDSAAKTLTALNSHIQLETYNTRLTAENSADLIANYDLVVDGTDNFATRQILAKECEKQAKTFISGAVNRFDGSLTTFQPHLKNADGNPNPRFEDLFPTTPNTQNMLSCEEAGIVGPLTGIIGSLQALEAIKAICNIGELLVGRQLLFEGQSLRFYEVRYGRTL